MDFCLVPLWDSARYDDTNFMITPSEFSSINIFQIKMKIRNENGVKSSKEIKVFEEALYLANRKHDSVEAWRLAYLLDQVEGAR